MAAAYATAGIMGWKRDLRSARFRMVWMFILLAGVIFSMLGFRPVEAILFAQVANGILLPVILFFMAALVNRREIMGPFANGPVQNVVTWATMVVLALLGVRLGPSANYGEAQYPATGAWGYQGRPLHTHIGYWAGDEWAKADFRRYAEARYGSIAALNAAWQARNTSSGSWPMISFSVFPSHLRATSLASSTRERSICSPRRNAVSPVSTISTLRSIWRMITSMCLSLIFTPCRR